MWWLEHWLSLFWERRPRRRDASATGRGGAWPGCSDSLSARMQWRDLLHRDSRWWDPGQGLSLDLFYAEPCGRQLGAKPGWNYGLCKHAWLQKRLCEDNHKWSQAPNPSTPFPAPTNRLLFLCLVYINILTHNKYHLMLEETSEDGKCFLKCLSIIIKKDSTELLCQEGKGRTVVKNLIIWGVFTWAVCW